MHELLNTLFVTTEGSYLHLDHDTLRLEVERETKFRMPLLHIGCIMCFGNVLISPALLHRCATDSRSVVLLDASGHFKARIEGPQSGNVLLRRAQHEAYASQAATFAIARNNVAGKIQNSRQNVLRARRETSDEGQRERLGHAVGVLARILEHVEQCKEIDVLRGHEGEAARAYFGIFNDMVREDGGAFRLNGRTRRPPLDRMNAMLSFVYTLLLSDCVAAAEGIGLDPQVGYLHVLRPGRPALALDLMEELRPVLADRLVLSLVNRRQIQRADFTEFEGGAVYLSETGRKQVITAYQQRKQDEVQHRVLDRKVPLGLVPHVQARILARHLRGDLPDYLPFLYR